MFYCWIYDCNRHAHIQSIPGRNFHLHAVISAKNWPHGHMAVSGIKQYRFQYSIRTTIPEPGIGNIDTWYLVSPSTVPFPFPGRLVPRLLPISSSTWALRRNEPEWWRIEKLCHHRNLWCQRTSFQVVIVITRREKEDLCSDVTHSDAVEKVTVMTVEKVAWHVADRTSAL